MVLGCCQCSVVARSMHVYVYYFALSIAAILTFCPRIRQEKRGDSREAGTGCKFLLRPQESML